MGPQGGIIAEPRRDPPPHSFAGVEILDRCGNDPSAGSPTKKKTHTRKGEREANETVSSIVCSVGSGVG